MTNSKGYRGGTRGKFNKPFRGHGTVKIGTYLRKFKVGDFATLAVDGAIHKGMPHHSYHGRTGRVFNVNPRSIGIIFHKVVGNRKIEKRLHARVEHVRLSRCREDFVKRVQENDKKKQEAKKQGKKISTKRSPLLPQTEKVVKFDQATVECRAYKPHIEIH